MYGFKFVLVDKTSIFFYLTAPVSFSTFKVSPIILCSRSAKANGTASESASSFPDMGGGFLSGGMGGDDSDNDNGLPEDDGRGGVEDDRPAIPTGQPSSSRENEKEEQSLGSFIDGLFGGSHLKEGGDAGAAGGNGDANGRDGRGGGGGVAGGGGGFPSAGLFSFMAPGNSISTIDKFSEVRRMGARAGETPGGWRVEA